MSLPHSSSDLSGLSRAAQRKLRLIEMEQQQRLEDMEALKMTEEQRQTLLHSFKSVKAEFQDLDGLSWSGSALCRIAQATGQSKDPRPTSLSSSPQPSHSSSPSSLAAFAVLTNADLASFGVEDTIRISRSSIQDVASATTNRLQLSSRSRSPVKNVFPGVASGRLGPSDSENCQCHDNGSKSPFDQESDAVISDLPRGRIKRSASAGSPPSSPASARSELSSPRFSTYSSKITSHRRPPQPVLSIPDDYMMDGDEDDLMTPTAYSSDFRLEE